jgi:hypothetical protein
MSDLSGRLYDHFHRESTVFRRWLLILASLCTFFLFVFVPYISATHALNSAQQQLGDLEQEIDEAQREVKIATEGITRASKFLGDASSFQTLYEDAQNWLQSLDEIHQKYDLQARRVNMLRDALPAELLNVWRPGYQPHAIIKALREARPRVMQNYDDDPCFFEVDLEWMRCQVARKLEPINSRLAGVLYNRTTSHEYTQQLESKIQPNRDRYHEGFGAAVAREQLVPWVQEYVENEQKLIRQWFEEMASERSALALQVKQQNELIASNKQKHQELALSRQELSKTGRPQTPFGPLPLTFDGILVLLPLLILLTATLLVRSQHRLHVLRGHYLATVQIDESERILLNVTMPLSPDPMGNRVQAIFILLGFALPAMVAVIGAKLLISIPELAKYGDTITIFGIVPIMLLLLLVFVGYLGRLIIVWRSRQPAGSP